SGWALANTAAVPVEPPATPANMVAKAAVTLTSPRTVMSPQVAAPRGVGRCWMAPRASRAAPATRARSAAYHSSGASRRPHWITTKHAPQAAVIHSIRNGLGRRGTAPAAEAAAAVVSTGTF